MPHSHLQPVPTPARPSPRPADAGAHPHAGDAAHRHEHGHTHAHEHGHEHGHTHGPGRGHGSHRPHQPDATARRVVRARVPTRHPLSLSAGWIDRIFVALPLLALLWAGVWWAMRPVFGG